MDPALEELVRSQNEVQSRIDRFIRNTMKLGEANLTRRVLNQRQKLLDSYWQEFIETHRKIARLPTSQTHTYMQNAVIDAVEVRYSEHSLKLSNLLSDLDIEQDEEAEHHDLTERTEGENYKETKLPVFEVDKFDGNILKWESFRDQFRSTIHTSRRLSSVQKLRYLKSYVIGEAAQKIANTPLTSANYEGAWNALERRYGNRRLLITAHINRLESCQPMTHSSASELKRVLDEFTQTRLALAALERPVESWDDWFSVLLVKRLDSTTRQAWETALPDPTVLPPFSDLETFLENRAHSLTPVEDANESSKEPKGKKGHKVPFHHATSGSASRSRTALTVAVKDGFKQKSNARTCPLCFGPHSLTRCAKYKMFSAQKRKECVHQLKVCLSCLKTGHSAKTCTSEFRCAVCGEKHNSTLHDSFRSSEVTSARPAEEKNDIVATNSSAVYTVRAKRVTLLATARVRLNSPEGRSVQARALLDPGSELSLVSEDIAQKLRLKRRRVQVSLTGLQETSVGTARHEVTVLLASDLDSDFRFQLDALVVGRLTAPTPSIAVDDGNWSHLRGLPLADEDFQLPKRVEVILGADVCGYLLLENRVGPAGTPPIVRTPFGWAPLGQSTSRTSPSGVAKETCSIHLQQIGDLRADLQRFWELEEVPRSSPSSPQDVECESLFQSTHARDIHGRYVVRLPFIATPMGGIGVPRPLAVKMLVNSERRRVKDERLNEKYREFMDEYLNLGHMEPASDSDALTGVNYLPHHAVWKTSGGHSKIRVVFNGSYVAGTNTPLNQVLAAGPRLQTDLWAVITRWRLHRLAFSTDIVKMFRQIQVHADDRDWQRIVWRSDQTQAIKSYRLTTVTYGTTSAPYLAIRVLHQLAEDEGKRFPRGAEILRRNTYVDDILAGGDNLADVEDSRRQLTDILMAGGFPLDKWGQNFQSTPSGEPNVKIWQVHQETEALGLKWNTEEDTLALASISLRGLTKIRGITKRMILSEMSQLFDPLGWVSPVLVSAKILIQDLWLAGVTWDEPLTASLMERWTKLRDELGKLKDIFVPRWVGANRDLARNLELHGFCDASERAYAAAVYIKVPQPDGMARTHLLMAKSKVAPTKPHSIPRLELCGAVLLARLMVAVKDAVLPDQTSLHAWTDASVVLAWIRSHASRWKPFVAHRVAEIQQLLPEVEWRHLRTADNPADLATRGVSVEILRKDIRWWNGPTWLKEDSTHWPGPLSYDLNEIPEKRATMAIIGTQSPEENDLLLRYSSMNRLIRVVAYLRRFILNARSKLYRRQGFLTTQELHEARVTVLRLSQNRPYAEEIACLRQNKPIKASSPLSSLSPVLDKDGILRVGGRLGLAVMTTDHRHPVIIDRHSPVATLIIRSAHLQTLHSGFTLTRASIRQSYWIPRDRTTIKRILRECIQCLRFRGNTGSQRMGPLPTVRVQPARAFLHSGVDYAGPITLLMSRGRGQRTMKGYIAVFVCMCTKAVHLEAVTDLTSATFIAAFRRFVSRRGKCAKLFSDNSTTFRGADQALVKMFRAASAFYQETAELLASDDTEWKFIPPYSPHFGGLWEAAVKSVKGHLRRRIGDQVLTFEELSTLLCQIEACLNSRPLASMSDDPCDLMVLTPSHLINADSLSAIPEPGAEVSFDTGRKRWNLVSRMLEHFWTRWRQEYLGQLHGLPKWKRARQNLKVGTMVLLKDDLAPPTKWPLGRIVDVHPGPDGLTRIAIIRTATRTIKRSITRLVPLFSTE